MSVDIELCIHTLNQGRRLVDPLTQYTMKMADEAATRMRAEFGDSLDMETCGKALVIAASMIVPLCREEIPGAVLANLIGFVGEDLVREARDG
jgi:hypothetical protein